MGNFYLPPKPLVVFFLDGFGIGPQGPHNAIANANTPYLDDLWQNYPSTTIELLRGQIEQHSHIDPSNEYLTIGSGREAYPVEARVKSLIQNKTIHTHPEIDLAIHSIQKHGSNFHIVTEIQSILDISLLEQILIKLNTEKVSGTKVFIHLVIDEDSEVDYIDRLKGLSVITTTLGVGHISSIAGKEYLSTERGLDVCMDMWFDSEGNVAKTWKKGMNLKFRRNKLLKPFMVDGPDDKFSPIEFLDSVLVLNKDILTIEAVVESFYAINEANKTDQDGLNIVSLVQTTNFPERKVLLPLDTLKKSLSAVLSENNKKQLKIGREDYIHLLTRSMNGGIEEQFPGEDTVIMAEGYKHEYSKYLDILFDLLLEKIGQNSYDVIFVSIQSMLDLLLDGDIDGMSHILEIFDQKLQLLWSTISKTEGAILLSSAIGGVENFDTIKFSDGEGETRYELPFLLLSETLKRNALKKGNQSDIAPTILNLLGIAKPAVMLGRSLIG